MPLSLGHESSRKFRSAAGTLRHPTRNYEVAAAILYLKRQTIRGTRTSAHNHARGCRTRAESIRLCLVRLSNGSARQTESTLSQISAYLQNNSGTSIWRVLAFGIHKKTAKITVVATRKALVAALAPKSVSNAAEGLL